MENTEHSVSNITRSDNLLIMSVYLEIERQNVLPQQ